MPIGFTLPFLISSGSLGHFQTTEDEFAAVSTDIHSILITNWGERVMHYDFGCNFREFLFEQIDEDELKQKMADRVLSQMAKWLPFVEIDELNIFLSDGENPINENEVGVNISFRLTSFPDLQGKRSFIVPA